MLLLPCAGEEPKSFGYGGTAKLVHECKFEDYGQVFGAGDVITAYVVSKYGGNGQVGP